MVGWWISAMFITKSIGEADGWFTLIGLVIALTTGGREEKEC